MDDARGRLVGDPYHYRDSRTKQAMDELLQRVPAHELYRMTGIHPQQINTLFQLYSQIGKPETDEPYRILLCRLIARATGRTVVAGPAEATAVGNVMMQAKSLGLVATAAEIREVVSRSFPPLQVSPDDIKGGYG